MESVGGHAHKRSKHGNEDVNSDTQIILFRHVPARLFQPHQIGEMADGLPWRP